MQSATESSNLIQYYAKQWKEGRGNEKKCSKRMEIVFHTGMKKILYQKVGYGLKEGKGGFRKLSRKK